MRVEREESSGQQRIARVLSEESYRTYFQLTAEGMWRVVPPEPVSIHLPALDQARRLLRSELVECNEAYARQYGYTRPEEMLGATLQEMMGGTVQERLETALAFIAAGYRATNLLVLDRRRDGTPLWVLNNIVGVVERGHVVCGWGAQRDVTELKTAQDELQAAKDYAERVVDTVNTIIIGLDAKGSVRAWNRAAELTTGYAREEVAGRCWLDVLIPARRDPEGRRALAAVPRPGSPRNLETSITTRAGKERIITWQVGPLFEQGQPAGAILSGLDVTDRRQTQAALTESEQSYREIYDNTSDCIFVVDVLPDGSFRFAGANPTAARTVGVRNEDIVGKPIETLMPPDEVARLEGNYRRCVEAGTSITYEEELPLTPGRRQFRTTLSPVRDSAGRVHRLIGIAHDITERKQVEFALQASEERFRAAFDQAAVGVCLTDLEGRIQRPNPAFCRITGYEEHELVDRLVQDITHPDDRARELELVTQALRGPTGTCTMEKRYVRKDGQDVWVTMVVSVIRDPAGAPHSVMGVVEDITGRRRAEEELRQLNEELERRVLDRTAELGEVNRELETFAYSVSHDLRAPLRSIDGFTQALVEDYGPQLDAQGLEFCQRVRAAAVRMGSSSTTCWACPGSPGPSCDSAASI